MDQASAQTEKISTYETSRTRRSIVDGNIHSDDSNNDEEYASSGFYVREKTTDKKQDSTTASKENNKDCKENGLSAKASSLENGENSEDGESSRDSKKDKNSENSDEEGLKPNNEKANKQKKKEGKSKEKDMEKSVKEKTELSKESNNGKEYSKDKKSSKDSKKDKSLENIDGKEEVPKISNEKLNKQKKKDEKSKEKKLEKAVKENTNLPKESNGKEHSKDRNVKDKDDICPVIEIKTEKLDENETEKNNTKNEKGKKQDKEINDTTTNGKEDSQQGDTVKEDPKQKASPSKTVEKETNNIEKTKDNENKDEKVDAENNDKDEATKAKIDDESKNTKITNSKEDEKSKEAEITLVEDDKRENEDAKKDDQSDASILKGQLEKNPPGNVEENAETEMEMDEDFDPSLLCPDISMDVDEAPVITSNPENIPDDGSTSPLPYEATFSTLVDEITGAEVQVDLTPEEMELRQQMYGPNNPVQKSKIHCTACNIHLGSALTGANNRFVHPLLKVLICKNCYHFYTSGEFEKDEDGSELYCRWCGQGGQVLCCSSCEFVFCKRCIRNNFGPKKFKEIRDSDDWNCFRCDRVQLSSLRASCAEFMEYYRTELARAQSLSQTHPELMTTDHTNCCKPGSEKKDETKTPTGQKGIRKKRKDEEDPDYHPVLQDPDEPPKKKFGSTTPSGGPGYTVIPPANSVRPIQPRPPQGVRPAQNSQNQGQVFKVGNTTFRAKAPSSGPGYTIQRPTVNPGQKSSSPGYITIPPSAAPKTTSPGYITIPPTAAPKTTSPGYIKILPQRMQGPRPTSSYTVVSGTNSGKPTFTTVRPKQATATPTPMKHEWFEKTVRAAARVNSNLSYTLTQLNRQQSQATSVEGLAMVHNKLQEVLSTSINSLIQIRKNLRTEFIAGIKNIKFPPKPAPIPSTSGPIVVKDDDDVIFVSTPKTTASLPPPPPLILSPSVTLTKKTPVQNSSDPFENPQPSTSGISANKSTTSKDSAPPPLAPVKGGFLKVRSFTSLQTVPSECITIPDDPPPSNGNVEIVEEEDPLKLTEPDTPKVVDKEPKEVSVDNEPKEISVDNEPKEVSVDDEPKEVSNPPKEAVSTFEENMVYNTKEDPSSAIKRMMGAHVLVKKSRVIDEIFRAQGMFNGKDNKTKTEEKERVIKDDSKKEDEKKENSEKNEEKKENEKTEKKQEEKTDEKPDDNMETEEDENEKEKEGETAKEESKTSETA